jgi:hypothetical protein
MSRGDGRKDPAHPLLPPQAAGMSCYSVAEEIMPGRADYLVEQRGFEPMAIAGAEIRQSREFHARADSRLDRENPARRSGGASSSTTGTLPSWTMYCRPESPCTCDTPGGAFSETRRSGAVHSPAQPVRDSNQSTLIRAVESSSRRAPAPSSRLGRRNGRRGTASAHRDSRQASGRFLAGGRSRSRSSRFGRAGA